jgi:hypothetical protein
MRTIPIYDVSDTSEIKIHNLEWDGLISQDNFNIYKSKISEIIKKPKEQHLEISRNSDSVFGTSLRTASLKITKGDNEFYAESLYQGSKMLAGMGDQHFLYDKDGNYSLKEKAKWKNKTIVGVNFFGFIYEKGALSELHDFLYWLGLEHTIDSLKKRLSILNKYEMYYFTDCFDALGKNSQSKSFSTYFWRWKRGESVWDFLSSNQKQFLEIINNNSHKKGEYITKKCGSLKALF